MPTQALEDGVVKTKLPNGLTVLVKPDPSTPIVAVNVWFGVGSVNETEEMNGLAHFQEHMVFKGTKKYGVGEIAKLVKSAGGNLNAGTSYSYTMYYIVLPSERFTQALEIQADAMMNSTFDPEEFTKERLVVIDEARMYDDRPESFTFYRTMELGYQVHNYRRPIAGYQHIVEKITRDQLLGFYQNYYRPGNAVLVVVGDVDPDEALRRIEDVYGGWEPGESTINESPVEPPQTAFRHKSYRGNVDHSYLAAGFHVPSMLHPDYPALEMLSELLSSGRSSRLYRNVLEGKRLVTSVSADMLAEKWPGFFLMAASMPSDKLGAARDAMFDEVERLKREPVPREELQKARRQIERSLYSELETMEGQASSMGYYELLGDYRLADEHREAIKRVTPEQVMAVARRYFHPDNCSLVTYVPETNGAADTDTESARAEVAKHLSAEGAGEDAAGSAAAEVAVPAPRTRRTATERVPDGAIERFELDNGVRVLLKRRTTVPLVSMLTVFQGGSRLEPAGKTGLATLAHRVLLKGTRSYSSEEIVDTIESLGGTIDSYANFDTGGVYANVMTEHLDAALPVYGEVVRQAAFDEERVAHEKAKLLHELSKRHDNPIQYTMDHLFRHVFGRHPYAYPFLGDVTDVESLTAEDCAAWYGGILVPANAVVSFVGDITPERARDVAERLLGDLAAGPIPTPAAPAPDVADAPGEYTLHKKDLKQSVTFIGYVAPPMMTEDAIALEVLNGVMTGLGGRLFVELRDKRSLGYMTGSAFSSLRDGSIFFGYANPGADGVDEALRVIRHELDRVTREEVTDEELERSKEWLAGSQIMQLQRNSAQAMAYGSYETLGFGYEVVDQLPDRIRKVTKEDLMRTAAKVFAPERAVAVKLLPEE